MSQTNLGNMFRLFSAAFKPPTANLADVVVSGELAQAMGDTWRALGLSDESFGGFAGVLETYRDRDAKEVLGELRREHTRLFLGDPPLVENSEGPWRKKAEGKIGVDLMVNSYSLEIQEFMRQCGAVKAKGHNDCIDYIEVECEFAAMLAERPQYLIDLEKDPLDLLDSFMDEHMKKWVPGFCAEVAEKTCLPYYRELCGLMGAFMGEF